MKVTLGQKVRDQITGFIGLVTGRVEYIAGCNQCLVQPQVKKDGDFVDSKWFDEDRLVVTQAKPFTLAIENAGPDSPAPRK